MRPIKGFIVILILFFLQSSNGQTDASNPSYVTEIGPDTSYISIAPASVRKLLVRGRPPLITIQLTGNYNVGVLDLAGNDNTGFWKQDFIDGRNFGTRHGFGFGLVGKIALHKEGNLRLVTGGSYNKLLSNFIIDEDPEGKVHYNVFSIILGLENNFTPDRRTKPYIGLDILGNFINGEAQLRTDTTLYKAPIKSVFRIGFSLNLGFEYAANDNLGFNLGAKFSHMNLLLKNSELQTTDGEIPFNDEALTNQAAKIPYSGWKQFAFLSFQGGVNIYFGMKDKK